VTPRSGLQDGIFSKPKIPLWVNLGGPWYKKGWIYFGHLEYIMGLWNILWPFGNLVWYIFPRLGILCKEKSGNPGPSPNFEQNRQTVQLYLVKIHS
jgi:hypothetical protein